MILTIYQSRKGDAILLHDDQHHILVDGGTSAAYTEFIAPELNKLTKKNIAIDLACVSHIDDDHIGGFLKMIEDLTDWRVFDYHQRNGNGNHKAPKSPRPPEIKEIWHNAFHEVVNDNNGEIEDMLAATANMLAASNNPIIQELGEIAQSKGQAIQLSRRLKPEQLNIPLNKRFKNKFAMIRKGAKPVRIGGFTIRTIAPFESDLDQLREEWNDWLKKNKASLKKIREKVEKDRPFLETQEFPHIAALSNMAEQLEPALLQDIGLLETAAKKLGVREKVTTPNLASLMFLVEYDGKTVLMTGDGHWSDILKGLEAIKKLPKTKGLHLDVLKVQHHGSEHNTGEEFCNRITADHYVFCGDGSHENPDLDVISAIIDSRTSKPAITPQSTNKFTLWFNSSSATTQGSVSHMKAVEKLVQKAAGQFTNVKFRFMPAGSKSINLRL